MKEWRCCELFQSSAGFDPGRYLQGRGHGGHPLEFQSSAGFDPGRYLQRVSARTWARVFQSSAGFDPGRYVRRNPQSRSRLVSILGRV